MSASRQLGFKTKPDAKFARALRRLAQVLTADASEGQLADALCRCVEGTPGVAACALYLDDCLVGSTAKWARGGRNVRVLPLTAGALGAVHVSVSDASNWASYRHYVANAVQLVALRIENLRQGLKLRSLQEEVDRLAARQVRDSGFIRDVTRQEQTEQELRNRHELMRYIIEHMRSAVAVLDKDLRYVYVSQRFLREVNAEDADVIGKRHYEVFPEIPEAWKEVHRKALQGEVLSAELDPFQRVDGKVYWTRWECRPWYDASGAIGGIVLYTEVINERIEAEEERRKLQAQLAQMQKMECVGRLAAGVAHDFNNLLTVINGYSDLVLTRLGPVEPLRKDVQEIRKSGERAAALTRQLLAFSRRQVLQPHLLDVNHVLREMEPMLRRLLGERIRVRVALGGDGVDVFADQHQLEQVVMNLVVNARDAMPDGGELFIEATRIELGEAAAKFQPEGKPGSYVMLAVKDTGEGMDEETMLRMFEPFFTTKQAGFGTGLGLSMVHGIVTQSGGFMDVASEPGKGTDFRLYLPAAHGVLSSPAETEPVISRGEETVLVVEDEDDVREYTAAVLKADGYQAIPCGSAAEALVLCEKPDQQVDLVVTDVVMPDMGGPELASRLAVLRPGTPVLFMSGYPGDDKGSQEPLEGERFLQKPFSATELAAKVRSALDFRRETRANTA